MRYARKALAAVISAFLLANVSALAGPVEDMMAADTAFAALAQAEGPPAAFAAYAEDEVRMFPDGGQPYQGKDILLDRMSRWPDGATLEWAPVEGIAAAGGDFGFTWGRYVYKEPANERGPAVENHGKYLSVWRKQADGSWKFIADLGNGNDAPDAAEKSKKD